MIKKIRKNIRDWFSTIFPIIFILGCACIAVLVQTCVINFEKKIDEDLRTNGGEAIIASVEPTTEPDLKLSADPVIPVPLLEVYDQKPIDTQTGLAFMSNTGTPSAEAGQEETGSESVPEEEATETVEEPVEDSLYENYYVGEGLMEDGSPVMVPNEPTEFLPIHLYHTKRMDDVHALAEYARSIGLPEDSPVIVECQRIWAEEKLTLDIMARMSYSEAGSCPWQQLLDTDCCLLHRIQRENWPNTAYECMMQPNQYSPSYTYGFENTSARCYAAAVLVLNGDYGIPNNVVYQANFSQGDGIWRIAKVDTKWFKSTTYFCYDIDWAKRLGGQ